MKKIKEDKGMYPPRFCVVIRCTPTARQSQARIEFRGTVNNPVFDIPLDPPPASPQSPSVISTGVVVVNIETFTLNLVRTQ